MASNEESPANTVPFADLCAVLKKLQSTKGNNKKQEQYKILSNFINEFRLKSAGKKNSSIFPLLRLILPKEERERSAYNLKTSKLGLLLVKVLSLSKESQDAKKLIDFRSVPNAADSDFAGVAYFVLMNRIGKNSGTLNVGDINKILDKIANAEVGNKAPILDEAMSDAIKHLSAEQMKWFLRIILKDLKLGMGHHRILDAFHPDAPELYDNCSNLSKVCEELEDGETRPPEAGIQVFFAVSPMLSERLDVTQVEQLSRDRTYHIETKFDGERFQMHMENGVFEYFSRKGYSWSGTYGKTHDAGLLTPHLKDCFGASVTSFVLDGEMMGWHKHLQCLGSKGMAFDVKKITENSKFRPCFCVFDVLYYNGKTLVGPSEKGGLPLSKRLELLDTMFTDIQGVIYHSKRQIVKESVDILDALNKAIEDQDEGIVVKDTQSYYMANRRNAGWHKIKPEYTEDAINDLDLVIIGADEAENKRQGRAKSFIVACADKVAPDAAPHRWLCVGRVATGLSYDERKRVCALLERHWVPAKRTPPPPQLVFNKEKPDFWILPEHSIALQVRATELIRSTHFGTEFTLRFPRVVRVRDDKPHSDVMTLDEFQRLVADKKLVSKLSTKRINEDQISDVEAKTRKKRTSKVVRVADQFRTVAGHVAVTSRALLGRKVCVFSDDDDCTKQELKRIVESHGGKYVENNGPDTWCSVVGRATYRTTNLIRAQDVDIATTAWLRALPSSDTPCSLSPLDMLSVKPTTKLHLSRNYDRFGDSYEEMVDEDILRKIFTKMDVDEPDIYLTNQEMEDLDRELFDDNNPYSFLRGCFIHFSTDNLDSIEARMYGATVCDINSANLTHVVVSAMATPEDVQNVRRNAKGFMVSDEWLKRCFVEERLVSETDFLI